MCPRNFCCSTSPEDEGSHQPSAFNYDIGGALAVAESQVVTLTMGKLQDDIKQKKRFRSAEAEAFLNLLRTADVLTRGMEEAVKPSGLSHTQYNVLRILRGAGSTGLACREIGERMITHDPDVTRLLDRLEVRGLITRSREKGDRRVVTIRVTKEGMSILEQLDEPMEQALKRQLGHVRKEQLRRLSKLLELARTPSVANARDQRQVLRSAAGASRRSQ